jgi:predicted transcriptional regulator YheO
VAARVGPSAYDDEREAARTLEARRAFTVRHGAETVASTLGVSRSTVHNHPDRERQG